MSMTNRLRLAVSRPQQVRNDVTVKTLAASGGLAVGDLTETTARKLSAVDGCMEILSNSISKLPNFVMDGRTREHVDHYLLRLLNVRPNEAIAPSIRRKVLENSRNEGGNGYDWIIRDPRTGIIRELIPVPWWLVQPWRDEAGRVWYTVTHPVTGTPMVLPNEDICHYKATTRDGLTGISPLRRAREVLAAAQAAQAYDLAFYTNGGQPGGALETDSDLGGWAEDVNGKHIQAADGSYLTRKDILRQEWEKVHAGPSNSHRLAILDLGRKEEHRCQRDDDDCGHRADDNGDRRLIFGRGAGLLGRKVAGLWRLRLSVLRPARLWLTVVWRLRLRRLVILRLPILRLTIRRSVRREKSPS